MTGLETRVIIGQLLDLYESEEELSVFAEHERVAPLAHGWYMAVRRLGLAIIQLVDSGFEFEAASLKRSLIEHVVALRWLIHAPDDAVTSLLRAHQRSVGKLQSAVAAAAWPIASDDAFNVILVWSPARPARTATCTSSSGARSTAPGTCTPPGLSKLLSPTPRSQPQGRTARPTRTESSS